MTPHQSPERRLRRRRRRRLPSSSAATTCRTRAEGAAKLPTELILEILSRLPVRSMCRFRCVSKGWRALLRDPIFVAAHKSLNAETFIVVSSMQKVPGGDRERRVMDMDGNDVSMIKGIHGFGLVSSSMDNLICITDGTCDGVCVINLATGKVLVDCPKQDVRPRQTWYTVFGFGRATPSGAYKVVRLFSSRYCQVFTLGDDNGWRWSECPPNNFSYGPSSAVAIKGVMYFLARRYVYRDTLLCFDIETEEWMKPIGSPQNIGEITIAELNDTVCMVQPKVTSYQCANIWLLADSDNDIWIKAYTIPMAEFIYHYKPLRVTRGGKLVFYCSVYGEGQALQVYDPPTETCTTLRRLDDVTDSISLCSLLGPPLSQA